MDYVQSHLLVQEGVPQALVDLAADPQTSGGLLAALPPAAARRLLEELEIMPPGPPSWERCCHSAPPRWKNR